jgi:hypothetical protein
MINSTKVDGSRRSTQAPTPKIFVTKRANLTRVREKDYITLGSKIVGAGATSDSHSSFFSKTIRETNKLHSDFSTEHDMKEKINKDMFHLKKF